VRFGLWGDKLEYWGRTGEGDVYLFELEDGIRVLASNYGGTLVRVMAPSKTGVMGDVILGFTSLQGYLASPSYHGATVGRYANRIRGGRVVLNGVEHRLSLNEGGNHLHGGFKGFDKRVWKPLCWGSKSLKLGLRSPRGEEGYPGSLEVCLEILVRGDTLRLEYWAEADETTVVNLTNHAYFNLGSQPTVEGHRLTVNADCYTPVAPDLIPLGPLEPVSGTPFDLRKEAKLGERLRRDSPQLALAGGFDHNFALNPTRGPQARLVEPTSGRVLEVRTSKPGLQLYTGNFLDGSERGYRGVHVARAGVCLETQFYPDSPHHPEYPSPVLEPGETYHHWTEYRFTLT